MKMKRRKNDRIFFRSTYKTASGTGKYLSPLFVCILFYSHVPRSNRIIKQRSTV